MKLFVVAAVLISFAAFSAAQDEPLVEGQDSCWVGRLVNGTGNMTEVKCSFTVNSCQTKIEVNQGVVIVVREFKQTQACNNNAANNAQNCYSAEAIAKDVRVCHFCCTTNFCNDFVDIPPVAIEPLEVDTEV